MLSQPSLQRIHLGCGLITPPGWVNVDGSFNARLAKHPTIRRCLDALRVVPRDKAAIPWNSGVLIHDVRRPLPFATDSASAIYASHVFEHLYLDEGQRLLRESFRVLAARGVLRIIVPDLHAIVCEYLGDSPFAEAPPDPQADPAADRLNRRLLLRTPAAPAGGLLYRTYDAWKDFHSHKWMYDAGSLAFHMASAGFSEVRPMSVHESRIEGIHAVEDPSRILKGAGVCVEGVKQA